MIRIFFLLCVTASTVFGHTKGLRRTFGVDNSTFGITTFVSMPQNITAASEKGWSKIQGPERASGYEKLEMWCPYEDYTECVHFDDTGYVAGTLISINPSIFENAIFEWNRAGFTEWYVDINGTNTKLWAIQQYFISKDDLATDPEYRVANRNSSKLIQGKEIYVTGFNGTIFSIPMNETELKSDTNFTEQGCIPAMGTHFYYNMRSTLECSVDTILTWFALVSEGWCVGTGFLWFGKYPIASDKIDIFEIPYEAIMKISAPDAPECIYNYSYYPGVLTSHTMFLEDPRELSCST